MKHCVVVHGVAASTIRTFVERFRRESLQGFDLAIVPANGGASAQERVKSSGSGIRLRGLLEMDPSSTIVASDDGCLRILSLSLRDRDNAHHFDVAVQAVAQLPLPPDILVLDLDWPTPEYLRIVRKTVPASVAIFLRLSWRSLLRISESTAVYSMLLGRYASTITGVWFDGRAGDSWVNVELLEPFIQRADASGIHAVLTLPAFREPRLWELLRDHPSLSLDLVQPMNELGEESDLQRFVDNLHALAQSVAHADAERKKLASSA